VFGLLHASSLRRAMGRAMEGMPLLLLVSKGDHEEGRGGVTAVKLRR